MNLFSWFDNLKMSWYRALKDPQDSLVKSRRRIFFGNLFGSTILSRITGGVFYTTLILVLFQGESETLRNIYIARIAQIQCICGLMEMLAPLILERLHRRKGYIMTLRILYHFLNIIGLAIVPLLPLSVISKANIFMVMMAAMSLIAALYGPGLSSWHIYSLTEESRSDYFSVNNMVGGVIGNGVSLIASAFMDLFQGSNGNAYIAIIIMRGVAILLAAVETKEFFGVAEPVYEKVSERPSVLQILTVPLHYPRFLLCVLVYGLWVFAQNLGALYYDVYLLTDAKMDYTYISLAGFLGLPLSLIFIPIWNQLIRKHGWFPCMMASVLLSLLTYILNGLVTASTHILYIIGALYYVAVAQGSTLGTSNLPYIFAPKSGKSSCLAFYNTVGTLASLLSTWVTEKFVLMNENNILHIFGLDLKSSVYASFLSVPPLCLVALIAYFMSHMEKKKQAEEENQAIV